MEDFMKIYKGFLSNLTFSHTEGFCWKLNTCIENTAILKNNRKFFICNLCRRHVETCYKL